MQSTNPLPLSTGVKHDHVKDIWRTPQETNELTISHGDVKKCGAASENCPSQLLLNAEQQQSIVKHVDDQHLLGATAINKKLLHETFCQIDIEMNRSCTQKCLHRLSLTWHPNKPKAKTFWAGQSNAIGSCIVGHVAMKKRAADAEAVLVCTDELHIHQGHQQEHSCF